MAFFRDEFEFGFVFQRRLLRLGQPRFAERLQPRKVVGRDHISRHQRRSEHEPGARICVERTGHRQMFSFLKNGIARRVCEPSAASMDPDEIARRASTTCASNTLRTGRGKLAGNSGATTNGRRCGATAFTGARTALVGGCS